MLNIYRIIDCYVLIKLGGHCCSFTRMAFALVIKEDFHVIKDGNQNTTQRMRHC